MIETDTFAATLRRAAANDLDGSKLLIMLKLRHEGHQSMGNLARECLISSAGATGVIDRLESRGLIKRTITTEDRRVILVDITENGIELLNRILNPEQQ